ncbi:valacyclovir hydrolase [Onthophagus taurus]|uniref:valacyclovir hydrolase n=1 Tax=Onthophagus taurus TaxID=166361 RepID=UPI0039BDDBD2
MLSFSCKLLKIPSNRNLIVNLCKYSTIKETKIQVKNQTINYVKEGNGPHKILCCPGALGTIWSDFKPQIEKLDKNQFTIIAWDPPGYGFSRPPNRVFNKEFYRNDADMAFEFMKTLGEDNYSILGWSDGGISAMILAAKYPQVLRKLVTWGSNAYIIEWEYQQYEKIRDVSKWSERMRAPLVKLYGNDGLQKMWGSWCDAVGELYKNGGDICKADLVKIKCPTFILHGDKDPLVAPEHPEFLTKNIKNSRLYKFPDGKHNIHLKYSDEFNDLVTKFLLE